MNEKLYDIYNDITQRLYVPLVFYFPRKCWNLLGKDKWDDEIYDDVFDKVILIKKDGSETLVNNELSSSHLGLKHEFLDKNTFKLLEIHKSLDDQQFNFVLNKYLTQLDFCRRMSKWMLENVQNDIKGLNKEAILSFELQQKSFQDHWKYVQGSFVNVPTIDTKSNKKGLSESDLKSIQELIKPSGLLSNATKENPIREEVSNITDKPKKEKKVLVTEEEATDFLLRTVFNME
jgi:hypothetical protein